MRSRRSRWILILLSLVALLLVVAVASAVGYSKLRLSSNTAD